jgi:hypothetical protein
MLTIAPIDPLTSKRTALKKFRSKHRRYDYFVDKDAEACIERLRRDNPNVSVSQIIDTLVEAGFSKLFPETKR